MELSNESTSENRPPADPGPDAARNSAAPVRAAQHRPFYLGTLIFVVVLGLPMVGVPALRHRLRTRVEMFRAAVTGAPPPVAAATLRVGENPEPFPSEYEKPWVRPSYEPILPPVIYQTPIQTFRPGSPAAETHVAPPENPPAYDTPPASAAADAPTADAGPQYRKGASEQEAYDLLLHSNDTLAGLVQGKDPSLKFLDWSAAAMGGDAYYVMVSFSQASDSGERKYIWSVKLNSKEIVPLSAYAREISK